MYPPWPARGTHGTKNRRGRSQTQWCTWLRAAGGGQYRCRLSTAERAKRERPDEVGTCRRVTLHACGVPSVPTPANRQGIGWMGAVPQTTTLRPKQVAHCSCWARLSRRKERRSPQGSSLGMAAYAARRGGEARRQQALGIVLLSVCRRGRQKRKVWRLPPLQLAHPLPSISTSTLRAPHGLTARVRGLPRQRAVLPRGALGCASRAQKRWSKGGGQGCFAGSGCSCSAPRQITRG